MDQLENKSTLWMGDLDSWMDENFIRNAFAQLGEKNVVVKTMPREKFVNGFPTYCFVDFGVHSSALNAMTNFNGKPIPNAQHKIFKLNWASGGGINDRREDRLPEYSIFVGDLGPEVTDQLLLNLFSQHYASVRSAKVVLDGQTGTSRGYGFVRFADENDAQRAMTEMQGQFCGSRSMRISAATPKSKHNNSFSDPHNTTLFVGNLTLPINDIELRTLFTPYGEITHVKVTAQKQCGFVTFRYRSSAEAALNQMNGYVYNGMRFRLSWGRSLAQRQRNTSRGPQPFYDGSGDMYADVVNSPLMGNSAGSFVNAGMVGAMNPYFQGAYGNYYSTGAAYGYQQQQQQGNPQGGNPAQQGQQPNAPAPAGGPVQPPQQPGVDADIEQ